MPNTIPVHTDDKRIVRKIESSLSSHLRFETVWLRFPKADELVDFIEAKFFMRHGFYLADNARLLLSDSIVKMIEGENFNGFITIKRLANDILFSLFESSINSYEVSATMLVAFNKDSPYIRRIISQGETARTIGFDIPKEEYTNEK